MSGTVGRVHRWQCSGPGFEPQVLTPFHIIFHSIFLCSFSLKEHHTSTTSGHPRAPGDSINGHNLKRTISLSQCSHTLHGKVLQAKVDGPKLLRRNLHFGDRYPPRFAILLFFISLYFFLLIIVFLINLIFS